MPVGALTSITHRVTNIFFAFGIPFGIYLLDLSLQGPQGYARVSSWFDEQDGPADDTGLIGEVRAIQVSSRPGFASALAGISPLRIGK